MPTRLSTAQRNAHADLAADAVDAGTGPGYIEVYTGTQPATVSTAATGTLLVTITLNDPAYGVAAAGAATLDVDPVPSGMVVADGTPGWFRVLASDGTAVRDGTISGASALVTDDLLEIEAGTLTMPESGA